jgi:hypothetical protein
MRNGTDMGFKLSFNLIFVPFRISPHIRSASVPFRIRSASVPHPFRIRFRILT